MEFKIIDNGKEIVCNIIKLFRDESNDINYVIYTDGSVDSDEKLCIYSSRYIFDNGEFVLLPIENDFEWNLIDNILESINKGGN